MLFRLWLLNCLTVLGMVGVACSPQTERTEDVATPVAASPAEPVSPELLGYALDVPETNTVFRVNEAFLRGDRVAFTGTDGGVLHLVATPLRWQSASAETPYTALVVEVARRAQVPTLYLVLLEHRAQNFVQRDTERLGERLLLVSFNLDAGTLRILTLDERLGRPPATGEFGGELYRFRLEAGELVRVK